MILREDLESRKFPSSKTTAGFCAWTLTRDRFEPDQDCKGQIMTVACDETKTVLEERSEKRTVNAKI